jgi:hypothetical protein
VKRENNTWHSLLGYDTTMVLYDTNNSESHAIFILKMAHIPHMKNIIQCIFWVHSISNLLCHSQVLTSAFILFTFMSNKLTSATNIPAMLGGSSPQHGTYSGCRWRRRPPDMEVSCENIEKAVADSRQRVVLQPWTDSLA